MAPQTAGKKGWPPRRHGARAKRGPRLEGAPARIIAPIPPLALGLVDGRDRPRGLPAVATRDREGPGTGQGKVNGEPEDRNVVELSEREKSIGYIVCYYTKHI